MREEAERQKAELEQRLLQYQEEMRIANEALRRYKFLLRLLYPFLKTELKGNI